MTRLEVRCCCQPTKLLGWLPVPEGVRDGQIIPFVVSPAGWVIPSADPQRLTADIIIALPVATFGERHLEKDGWRLAKRLALKSEETPIERLRLIPGFIEAPDPSPPGSPT